jgi:MFS family permease
MMSERTALITARRESEDNLIKTIIQLSAALLALLAGFISQAKIRPSALSLSLFGAALFALAIAIVTGLLEQRFSSQAYLEQQKLVEDYFQKKISTFDDPPANKLVRKAQAGAFVSFLVALICLGIFAFAEARNSYVEAKGAASTSAAATSTTSATSSSSSSSSSQKDRRRIQRGRGEVGGANNAAAATAKEITRH